MNNIDMNKQQTKLMSDINYLLQSYRDRSQIDFDKIQHMLDFDYGYDGDQMIRMPHYQFQSIIETPLPEMNASFKKFIIDALDEEYVLTLIAQNNKIVDLNLSINTNTN